MWVVKFQLRDKNCIWATRCKKFNVYDYQYPLGFYWIKNNLALMMHHIFEGNENKIRIYIRDVKNDYRVKKIEFRKNYAISLVIEKETDIRLKTLEALYNQRLIYIRPGINFPDGTEIWEIGAFNRTDLTRLFNYIKKYYEGRLLFMKQIKSPHLFIPQIMPNLTEKQLHAFKLASKEGYYEFPRKTNLHQLAKLQGISRPTFEEHLRKSEIRLLKFMQELILK